MTSMSKIFVEAKSAPRGWFVVSGRIYGQTNAPAVPSDSLSDDSVEEAKELGWNEPFERHGGIANTETIKMAAESLGGKELEWMAGANHTVFKFAFETSDAAAHFIGFSLEFDEEKIAQISQKLEQAGSVSVSSRDGLFSFNVRNPVVKARKGEKSRAEQMLDRLVQMDPFTIEQARQVWIELAGRDVAALPKYWGAENVRNIVYRFGEKQAGNKWKITKEIKPPFVDKRQW